MRWTKFFVLNLVACMVLVLLVASGGGDAQELGRNDAAIKSTYERERANALESLKQSRDFSVELAKENSHTPDNPKVIETYLAAMQAEIDGDIEKCMTLLEESYLLSLSESGESLWNVLRCNYSDSAEHLFYIVDRLEGDSYEEKLVKYDHFSRYQPSDDRIQAHLLEVMLERMSYDAVQEYCGRRIAEGHDVYRVLRAELRLLIQQEAIDRGGVRFYEEQIRRALQEKGGGAEEVNEASVRDRAQQSFFSHYDPTLVEPSQFNLMIKELRDDSTCDVARLKQYCGLLRVGYKLTRANEDVVDSYCAYAKELIGSSEAEIRGFRQTHEEMEAQRDDALSAIRAWEDEIGTLSKRYAKERETGVYGPVSERAWVAFDFTLDKRWDREKASTEKGEELGHLSLEDVFGPKN